jgi:transcriptional regulator with XRE-family HTH domain
MKPYTALVERVCDIEEVESDYEDVISEYIGAALMVVRVHRRISQVSLARMLSQATRDTVTQGYISKVEKGRTRVSSERLSLFCRFLKCLPSQVWQLAEFLANQSLLPERDVIANLLKETEARLEQ